MIRPRALSAFAERLDRLPVYGKTVLPLIRSFWVPALLGGILLLAAVVRVYDIVGNPPGFFADEASYGYNAYSVMHTGKDEHGATLPLFFEAFGEHKLAVYTYSTIPFISLLGLTELAVRLTSAVYGVLAVLAVYLLVRALFKERALALTAAAILAVLPWHIHYSRTGFGNITAHLFFLVLGSHLFVVGTRRPLYWLASALAFVLALYSYRSAWVIAPPLVLILAFLYSREVQRHWRIALPSLLILVIAVVPILIQVFTADTDRAREESLFGADLGLLETGKTFLQHYRSHFTTSFLFEGPSGGNLRHYLAGFGVLYWWQAPFIILGLLALLWKPSRPKFFVLGLLLVYPLAAALSTGSPSSNRALLGAVAFSIIIAFGVLTPVRIMSGRQWPRALRIAGGGLAAVVLVGATTVGAIRFASYLDAYHGEYKRISADFWGWQWGPGEIVERFVSVEGEYDQLVMDGAFNAPYIFYDFYAPNDCENCIIGHWDKYVPGDEQLFALRPESMWFTYDYDVREVLRYPNGQPAFVLAEIAGTQTSVRGNSPMRNVGDSQETLAALTRAIGENPELAEAYLDRGNAYFGLGLLGVAIEDYSKAIELDPSLASAYVNRGNAHWSLGSFRRGNDDYERAVELDANLTLAHYNWGNALLTLGRFDKARERYSMATELDPGNADAHNNFGNLYVRMGYFEEAIAELNRAIELDPMLAEAYANRGHAYGQGGASWRAIADLDKAIELNPELALAYNVRGIVYRDMGEVDQAKADFDKAIALDARYAEAYANRALTYEEIGGLERAMADYDEAIALDGDYSLAYANRGIARLNTNDFEEAIADLEKAIGLDHSYSLAHNNYTENPYWSLGDFDRGVEELEQALTQMSDSDSIARTERVIDYLLQRG